MGRCLLRGRSRGIVKSATHYFSGELRGCKLPQSPRVLAQGFLQLLNDIIEFARIFRCDGPGNQSLNAVLEATLWQAAIRSEYYIR